MRKRALEESDNDLLSPSKLTPPELSIQSQGKRGRDESEDDSPKVLGMLVVKRVVLDPMPDALVVDASQSLQRSLRVAKRNLIAPEPGSSSKRARVLPAEQQLMQMDALQYIFESLSIQ